MSVSQKEQILEAFKKLDAILGIFDLDLKPLGDEEKNLIERRQRMRAIKNWQEADRLRIELQQWGIRVIDTAQGVRWERFEVLARH